MSFALSKKSLQHLEGVHPDLVKVVKHAITFTPVDFGVLHGARTQEEQNRLYAQGRSAPGDIVTWTLNSRHIGGFAADLGAYKDGVYVNGDTEEELDLYGLIAEAMLTAAEELGIPVKWGVVKNGKRTDTGHFELPSSEYPA